ncbi:MAG TPA: hypothetical protein VK171_03805 [Fimbriimonas sp.]|nr:hypothetical protein [Fimbriimonas sp.]
MLTTHDIDKIVQELTSREVTEFIPSSPSNLSTLAMATDDEIPTSLDQLTISQSHVYELTYSAATQANIPVGGSVSGGASRRVIVMERYAAKALSRPDGEALLGYAVRLAISVSKRDASMKLSLPFLAASAEVGLIEAQWSLNVLGLIGQPIDAAILPPKELSVDTFVLAQQSLGNLITAVHNPQTRFTAEQILVRKTATQTELTQQRSIGFTYGLATIERRWELQRAMNELGAERDSVKEALVEVYASIGGLSDPLQKPSEEAQRTARKMLGEVNAGPR